MPSCCVTSCASSQLDGTVSFHRFPRCGDIRAEWLKRTGQVDNEDVGKKRVCSLHFLETDFDHVSYREQLAFSRIFGVDFYPTFSRALRKLF
jgi:hypothetical protein